MPKRKTKRSYELDDGPLTPEYVAALRSEAAKHLPTGAVLARSNLFPDIEKMAASLWEPSTIEDAFFEKLRERHPQTP